MHSEPWYAKAVHAAAASWWVDRSNDCLKLHVLLQKPSKINSTSTSSNDNARADLMKTCLGHYFTPKPNHFCLHCDIFMSSKKLFLFLIIVMHSDIFFNNFYYSHWWFSLLSYTLHYNTKHCNICVCEWVSVCVKVWILYWSSLVNIFVEIAIHFLQNFLIRKLKRAAFIYIFFVTMLNCLLILLTNLMCPY